MRFVAIALLLVSSILYGAHHNKAEIQDGSPVFYRGLEEIENGYKYEITLISEQGRIKKAKSNKEKKIKLEENPHPRSIGKPKYEWNDVYYKVANLLPAGTIFKITRASDWINGDLRIEIKAKDKIDIEKVKQYNDVFSIEFDPEISTIGYVEPVIDTSTEFLEGWKKEQGYKQILHLLNSNKANNHSGQAFIKVSIVFENTDNESEWSNKPFAGIIRDLIHNQKGYPEGFGYDDRFAWWTHHINSQLAQELYENDLVVNLVPRLD